MALTPEALVELDLAHLIHPQHNRQIHQDFGPIVVTSGHGIYIEDIQGRRYIDGLASLWNVAVGHGRAELAEAAAAQMKRIAYYSTYTGTTNIPAIELAARLAELAPPHLNHVYFTTGGAESNESAIKTARYYWKKQGYAHKEKIISRRFAYHGVTAMASQATGIQTFWKDFEPHAPGFVHVIAPYPYRLTSEQLQGRSVGETAAAAIEEAILAEGADNVAAVIGEPIMGAGGVIVPPADYWPRVREICDRHNVLLIDDEIITGFGRTGNWWGCQAYGYEPDILVFAKAVTSGYLPLGGIIMSDTIADVINGLPKPQAWMHAATYSGHATCCAVGLANLDIYAREGLVEHARQMSGLFQARLQGLANHPLVGEARGLGMVGAVELVVDKAKKTGLDPEGKLANRVRDVAREHGLLARAVRDIICLAPPLVITEPEINTLFDTLTAALDKVADEVLVHA